MKTCVASSKRIFLPFILASLLFAISLVSAPVFADETPTETQVEVSTDSLETKESDATQDTTAVSDETSEETATNAVQMVMDMIDGLPNPESITLNDEATLSLVRGAYDKLSEGEKSAVTNIGKLEQCEKTFAVRKEQQNLPPDTQMYSYTFSIDSSNKGISLIVTYAGTRPNFMLLSPDDKEFWLPVNDATGNAQVAEDDIKAATVESSTQTIINISDAKAGNWVLKTSTPVSMLTQPYNGQISEEGQSVTTLIQVNKDSILNVVEEKDIIMDGNDAYVNVIRLKEIAAKSDNGIIFADVDGNIITITQDGKITSSTGNAVMRIVDGDNTAIVLEETASRPVGDIKIESGEKETIEPETETKPQKDGGFDFMSLLSGNNYLYVVAIVGVGGGLIIVFFMLRKRSKQKAMNANQSDDSDDNERSLASLNQSDNTEQIAEPKQKAGLFGPKKDKKKDKVTTVQDSDNDITPLDDDEKVSSDMDELARIKAEADKMWESAAAAKEAQLREEERQREKKKESDDFDDDDNESESNHQYFTNEDIENDVTIEEYVDEDDYDDSPSSNPTHSNIKKQSFFPTNRFGD